MTQLQVVVNNMLSTCCQCSLLAGSYGLFQEHFAVSNSVSTFVAKFTTYSWRKLALFTVSLHSLNLLLPFVYFALKSLLRLPYT